MKMLLTLSLILLFVLSCSGSDSNPSAPSQENRAPVLSSITMSPSSANTGETCTLSAVATDQDGDNLTYTWSGDNGTFATTTGSSVQWTAPSTAGSYSVSCTVSDGEDNDTETLAIQVTENEAPVISSITASSSSIYPSETTTLTVVATDAEGDELTYTWSSAIGTFNTTAGTSIEWTAPSEGGEYNIECVVSDGYSTATDTITIMVIITETVTDIDGNVYNTIKIGDQWWMVENLKVTHYKDGTPIPKVTGGSEWASLTSGAQCIYSNDSTSNLSTYGRLYNWYAVDDSRNIAPEGWHVPTDEEWKELEMYLGMSQSEADDTGWRGTDEGDKLKEAGHVHWNEDEYGDINGTNESGFTALPGGYRSCYYGNYSSIGYGAYFWSSSEGNSSSAWSRRLGYLNSGMSRNYDYKAYGFSVRCVRDK